MPQNLSIFSFQFSPPTARHYHPTLSIWLSVDPMADKYPSTSPYTYCGNNPVRLVDPDGREIDEWEVNKAGFFRHVEGSEGRPDKLYVVKGFRSNRFKKRCDNGINVNPEMMQNICSISDSKTSINYNVVDHRQEMHELFNYLADNTNVEWVSFGFSFVDIVPNEDGSPKMCNGKLQYKNSNRDFLITDHQRIECGTGQSYNHAARLDYFKHSHPAFYFDINYFLDPMQISGNKIPINKDDYEGDYGHKRKCVEAGSSCVFTLRYRGDEKTY